MFSVYLLLDDSLDAIQAFLQGLHPRSIAQTNEMMARAIEKVPAFGRIQVEEDARHHCA